MTATRPYLDPTIRRECRLYRIRGLDPRTGYKTITLIYVGETGRLPFVRFIEHLYEQPFGDTIVGQPEVDRRVFGSKTEVWAAERAAIESERPLYNYEHNQANPNRILIPVAREQRWARDRAAGRALWQPGERTQAGSGTVAVRRVPLGPASRWTWCRVRRILRAAGWTAVVAGWFVVAGLVAWKVHAGTQAEGHPLPAGYPLGAGAAVASGLYLLAWWKWPAPRRRRRRRRW